jgi:hypothetical protein
MRSVRRIRPVFFVSIFALLMALSQGMFASGHAASVPGRITQQIDENNLVKLAGNTRPEANATNDRGAVADGFNVDHILLVLQRSSQQEEKVAAFIDSLNDRKSPNFHRWLTAEEFGARFGVAQQDIDTVRGWLESQGFHINQVYASHMMLDISGTAGQVREAFHTSMHNLEVNGEQHISNMSDPMIPAALAPVMKGIFSLHDFKPHKMLKQVAQYTWAGCASSTDVPTEPGTCYAMTPADNQTIYDLTPLYNAGYSGQGQTIALVEDTDSYGTDFATYRSTFGLDAAFPAGNLVTTHPGGCTDPGTNADDSEADLDVEIASAIAPSATIELISCPSGTVTFGGVIALQNMINAPGPYPGVVSVSYGVCEAANGNGGNATFYNAYQQAAAEGISVFGASGDEGPSSCSSEFGVDWDYTSLGVSGWTETPYNVAVGGTDFEDVYNAKTGQNGGNPLSNYWSAANGSNYGSALSYIPEMPWDDSCANVLVAEVATGNFQTYGSGHICGTSPYDTSASYLSTGAASGGASNCALGNGGLLTEEALVSDPTCQGYPKPSWQSAYGVPNDGLRDIPDVSMFAANGIWGHYEVVCWSDPAYTADGSAVCTGAPSTWSGFGGTSVASPTMAAIQALVNQKTGEIWGNPNPIYYQIAQSEYGTQGGTFAGASCNSSNGSGGACVFNDVTQGDIDVECEDDGTAEEAHCYDYISSHGRVSVYGVDSTDVVTAATVLNGGSGYTTAPTCAIAGPTNSNPYLSPTGSTLYAGGSQAACTATVNSGTTTAVWTITMASTDDDGATIVLTNPSGSVTCGPYPLSGASTTAMASNLVASIGSSCSLASASSSSSTVTLTANATGYAGDFIAGSGPGTIFNQAYVYITNTTKGQGPNYVSGITITTGGSGYQPEAPMTLTGGGGSGAVAIANTSNGTASSSYQPAYGAAPGYDLATGLGTVNAYNLVASSAWLPVASTAVSSSLNPSTYGQAVSFTATVTGNSPTGTVQFTVDGSAFGSPVTLASGSATSGSTSTLTQGTHTVTATYSGDGNNQGSTGTLSGGQVVNQASAGTVVTSGTNPSSYGQSVTFTATISGEYGQIRSRRGQAKSQAISGTVQWSANTGCGTTPVTTGNPGVATCTTSSLPVGTDTITGTYSGDSNHGGSTGTLSGGEVVNQVVSSTAVLSSLDPSTYGQAVSFTANVTGSSPTGTVQFNVDGSAFGSPVTLVSGSATSGSISTLTQGTHTVTAVYSGDGNNQGSTGTLSGGQVVNQATAATVITSGTNPSSSGQSVTFTATISGEYGLLKERQGRQQGRQKVAKRQDVSGMVQWSTNTGCGTTPVTTGNPGIATCTTSSLPVGTDTITGTYSGDIDHSGSTGTLSGGQQVLSGSSTAINVTSVSPASEDYGQDQQITITAVLSWTGNGVAPTASDVTINGNGPSGTYGATSCGAPSGDAMTCTATYTPTAADAAGSYTESATFAGDSNYSGSSSTQTNNFAIAQASSSTSVTSGTNPSTYGQSVTFTATIDGEYGLVKGRNRIVLGRGLMKNGAKSQDVSGSVQWSANTGCGTTTVTAGNPGTATCTTTSLPGGTDTITATYSGDSNHSGSTGTLSGGQVVNPTTQTITFTMNAPAKAVYGTSFTVAAGASSGLPITYSSGGSCSNMGATYTMTSGTGTCTVTASQPGNNDYQAASPVSESTTAERANQTVTFTGAPAMAPYSSTFVMTASTDASTVAYITTSSPTTCSLSGPYSPVTVTMLKDTGKCTFTASWGADQNYNPATATQTTTAEKATPVISWATPAAITYGTPLSGTQLDASANVAGTFTYSPASGKIEAAGNDTLKVTFKPSSADYSTTTDSVTLQVLPAATVTTTTSPSQTITLSKVGVATATLDFNVTSYEPTGSVTLTATTGETCSGTLTPTTGDGKCKLTFNTPGVRTITATYGGDSNHNGSNSSGQNPPVTVTVKPY